MAYPGRSSVRGLRADPHIVAAWIKGWTIARETSPPVADRGGFRVDVGWPQQKTRYVFPALVPAIGDLAAAIEEPWVFLKACTTVDALQPLLPVRWVIQRPGFLMVCPRSMPAGCVLPQGYVLEVATGTTATVRVLDPKRDIAAMGHLVTVEDFAVYDRIETQPAHRRRGLARVVMTVLETIGRRKGAGRGVLVATPEGRPLYESLGWELHSPYTTAVIPGV